MEPQTSCTRKHFPLHPALLLLLLDLYFDFEVDLH